MGFTKLSESIVTSSIWVEDHDVLRVWIYLLARCGPDGMVRDTAPAIAHACMVTLGRLREIFDILQRPDEYSRTPNNEGRRIAIHHEPVYRVEILNYEHHRSGRSEEDRREQWRLAKARCRLRKTSGVHEEEDKSQQIDGQCETSVGHVNDVSVDVHTRQKSEVSMSEGSKNPLPDSDARTIPPTRDQVEAFICHEGITNITALEFFDIYEASGWRLSNGNKMKNWQSAVRNCSRRRAGWASSASRSASVQRADTLTGSTSGNWRGNPICQCRLPKPKDAISCYDCAVKAGGEWLESYDAHLADLKASAGGAVCKFCGHAVQVHDSNGRCTSIGCGCGRCRAWRGQENGENHAQA